jgi:hypothetical protein
LHREEGILKKEIMARERGREREREKEEKR